MSTENDEYAECPHCGKAVCLSTVSARQTFVVVITANQGTRLSATTVGTAILEIAKSIENTAANMGDSVSVMLENVIVSDGRVEVTMMECDNFK